MMDNSETWSEIYKTSNYGNKYASSYLVSLFHQRMKALLVNRKELRDCNVLDFGCSVGANARFFADLGMNVYGIDISETAIKKLIEDAWSDEIHFKAANVLQNGITISSLFEGKSFDLIIASECMYYFTDKERNTIVNQFYDSMSDGGVLYVNTHSFGFSWYSDKDHVYDQDGMIILDESGSVKQKLRVRIPKSPEEFANMYYPFTVLDILKTNVQFYSDQNMEKYHLLARKEIV